MQVEFPPRRLPEGNRVDVWRIDLDALAGAPMRLETLLSAEERERAGRLARASDAERFRCCRAMLRLGLAWYLREPPGRIALTAGWRGKPRLAEASGLRFNVSHTGGLALIAFTTLGEVGVDVEVEGREVEAREIADLYFHRNEARWIDSGVTERERKRRFLRIWTRKEAAMKAAGCGIAEGLEAFDVSGGSETEVTLPGADGEARWQVRDLEAPEGCFAALASTPGAWSIRQFALPNETWLAHLKAIFSLAL